MKMWLITICIATMLITGGCFQSKKKPDLPDPALSISSVMGVANQQAKDVKDDVNQITTDADAIKKGCNDKDIINRATNIQEHSAHITNTTTGILENVKKLNEIRVNYEQKLADKNKEVEAAKKEAEQAKNQANGWIYKTIIAACVVVFGLGIFLGFIGNRWGFAAALAALFVIGTLVMLQRYEIIAGLAIGGTATVMAIAMAIENWAARKKLDVKDTALKEVVGMVDNVIKPVLPDTVKEKIFGPKEVKPEADTAQSDTTKKVVAEIRGK